MPRLTVAAKALQAARAENDFLDTRHPIYEANHARWLLNENRYAGGDDVLDELEAFDWETDLTEAGHWVKRRGQAIYINFPEIFCSAIAGHLLKFAPKPGKELDFGGLGEVGKTAKTSSRADMVYENPDGPGNTGSGWDLWWADTLKLAIVTGHRWIFVEAPVEEPGNQQREKEGLRPYLVEYSPLDVPNWDFVPEGELAFAIVRFWEHDPGRLINYVPDTESFTNYNYLLVTRPGFTRFGPRFAEGGWWKFTPEKDQYDSGEFDDTMGKVPMFPLYYERSKGTRKRPAMSRPGVTELGQAAIAAMNVASAANFNAVDIGQGLTWLAGVDEEGQELAVGQIKRGDRFIGLPPNQDTEVTPTVSTSGQTSVTSTIFDTRERAIWSAVVQLGISEAAGASAAPSAKSGPGQSGAAQQASHSQSQAPRISKVASNLELAQQIAIDFYHLRFGAGESTGSVKWLKKFDLVELIERIKQFFEVQRLAGVSSETLDAKAMLQVAEDKGLISQSDKQKILAEFTKSAKLKQEAAANTAAGAGSKMAPPQKGSTAEKQKARMAGRNQDKKKAGRNTGNKSNKTPA